MPFEIIWEGRGAYKRFTGVVSFEEYSRSQQLVLGDARADDLLYIINDFRVMEGGADAGTSEQAEYLGAFNYGSSRSNPRIRIAYVTSDLKLVALLKVASVLSSYQLRNFATLEEARAWAMQQPLSAVSP